MNLHPKLRRSTAAFAVATTLMVTAWPGVAQDVPAARGEVYALSPDEKLDALDSATGAGGRDEADVPGGIAGLPIHGEFGALVGTGGMRSVYGTAAIPLGENGGAIISFENSRFGNSRRR